MRHFTWTRLAYAGALLQLAFGPMSVLGQATPAPPSVVPSDNQTAAGLPRKLSVEAPKVALVGEEVVLKVMLSWPANSSYSAATVPYMITQGRLPTDPILLKGEFAKADSDGALASEIELNPFKLDGTGAYSVSVHLGEQNALASSTDAAQANIKPDPDARIHSMPGWITLLPIIALIGVALITQQVLMALFCGVFLSAMFVNFYNPLTGFLRSTDHYMVLALSDPDHDKVLLFTWFLAGLIALIQRSGGAEGLAQLVTRWATNRWRGLWVTFGLGMLIFFDDFASCLIVGTNMVQVTDMLRVSREKLAFYVHATSSPPASISPVSSWIGYEVGLISAELRKLGSDADPFMIFLKSVVGRFYPIFMLLFVAILTIMKRDFGPMLRAERRAFRTGQLLPDRPGAKKQARDRAGQAGEEAPATGIRGVFQRVFRSRRRREQAELNTIQEEMTEQDAEMGTCHIDVEKCTSPSMASMDREKDSLASQEEEEGPDDPVRPIPGKPRRWFNAVVPIAINVFLIVFGIFITGYYNTLQMEKEGQTVKFDVASLAGNGDSYGALIYASLFTSIFSIVLYKLQGILTISDSLQHWVVGIKEVFEPVLILILAWAIGTALNDLRTAHFIVGVLRGSLDPRLMGTLVFITACVISFVTGTSWGTMAILFPLAIPLAAALQPGDETAIIETVASILTGAIFGDQCSPISGTSVMSALSSKCPLPAHVTTQLPYALLIAVISILVGYLPVGYKLYPPAVALPIGIVVIFIAVFLLGSKVEVEEGEEEEGLVDRVRGLFRRKKAASA